MHSYLKHLANFARVVEAGSLKAASELLGTAPSGLSESIKLLETRYGGVLLERHKSGMRPTSEGERVYAHARTIVDELHQVFQENTEEMRQQVCKISLPGEIAQTLLCKGLIRLQELNPQIQMKIFVEDELIDPNRFGRDFYLRISSKPIVPDGMRALWSTTAKAVRAIPSQENLKNAKIIPLQSAVEPDEAFSIQVNDAATRLMLAAQGVGQTKCIDICAINAPSEGLLIETLNPPVQLTISLFTPHRRRFPLETSLIEAVSYMFGEGGEERKGGSF